MDQARDLANWRRVLGEIQPEGADLEPNKISKNTISELTALFEHLATQTAPRLQRDYEQCTMRSDQIFKLLFDVIDLSDKPLLAAYLNMLRSFGYFRLAQISYHIDKSYELPFEPDPLYAPQVTKAKWYDMCPLLPQAGTIGWKSIMHHGMVKEEPELMHSCIRLLTLKLHFLSVVAKLEKYRDLASIIRRNGEKVAEKFIEMITDTSCDDEATLRMNFKIFNLLIQFTDDNQNSVIIEAIVQDLMKPQLIQSTIDSTLLTQKLARLFHETLMNRAHFQDILITKLIEHLKCNLIRRKRRHSVEESEGEETVTIESLISNINSGDKHLDILAGSENVIIKSKSFQISYVNHWTRLVNHIILSNNLTSNSSTKLIGICSLLLVCATHVMDQSLREGISALMGKAVEKTMQSRLDKLFNCFDLTFVVNFANLVSQKLAINYDSELIPFFKTYLTRYLKFCVARKQSLEKVTFFVESICDNCSSKEQAHLLQYIFLDATSDCLDSFKTLGHHVLETYMSSARTCAKKMYKFVKRNSTIKHFKSSNGTDTEMEVSDLDNSIEIASSSQKKYIAIRALICIAKIALNQKDEAILDIYGDLLLKLFNLVVERFKGIIECLHGDSSDKLTPIDSHMATILRMYIKRRETIKAYMDDDLTERLISLVGDSLDQANGQTSITRQCTKKETYNKLKAKLEALDERSKKSAQVYHNIINKQYTSVSNQSLPSTADIDTEKSCCHDLRTQMSLFSNIITLVMCDIAQPRYKTIFDGLVISLERLDPLDHGRMLYLFLILECIVTKSSSNDQFEQLGAHIRDQLPKVSCSLFRISKSVELGPSIHAFTNPGSHTSNRSVQCCTYANCIKVYTLLFQNCTPKLTNSLLSEAMQLCVSSNLIRYARYSTRLHRYFIQLSFSVIGLLKAISIGRKDDDSLKKAIPIFFSVFSNLVRCIILASDRQKLEDVQAPKTNGNGKKSAKLHAEVNEANLPDRNTEYETQLELLALDIARTLNNMSLSRVKLVDFAPHLISAFVKDTQKAACPDFVRIHLNEGIYRIFNLIDAHEKDRREALIDGGVQRKTNAGRASGSLLEMIHARLDQASREIFKDMHDDYSRFYKYVGKC